MAVLHVRLITEVTLKNGLFPKSGNNVDESNLCLFINEK